MVASDTECLLGNQNHRSRIATAELIHRLVYAYHVLLAPDHYAPYPVVSGVIESVAVERPHAVLIAHSLTVLDLPASPTAMDSQP